MKRRDKSQHKFEICLGYPCFSLELTPNGARTLTVFSLQRNKEVLGDLVTSPAAARLKNGKCLSPFLPTLLIIRSLSLLDQQPSLNSPRIKPRVRDLALFGEQFSCVKMDQFLSYIKFNRINAGSEHTFPAPPFVIS